MEAYRFNPTGGLNVDSDPRYLNNGNYRDANNVRPVTDEGGTTNSIESIRGTLEKIGAITVPEQNKVYRFEGVEGSGSGFFNVYDANGNLKASSDVGNASNFATVLDNVNGISASVVDTNLVEAEIENGNDWTIEVEAFSGQDMPIDDQYVYQEQLSGDDNTGEIHWLHHKEVDDRLYLWGTTSITSGGGLGEIGMVQKDYQGNITYTRLIRSKRFGFSTQYDFDVDAEESDFRTSLYWTDFNNPWKTLFHETIGSDDFVLRFNGGNYDYSSIVVQTNLVPEASGTRIDFRDQLQQGGGIESGTWRYTYRFLTENLEESEWGTLTNQIPVFEERVPEGEGQGAGTTIRGSGSGNETSKINRFEVSGINTERYRFIELAGVHYVGSTPQGYILKRERINGETMQLRHTGNEANVTNFGNLADLIGVGGDIPYTGRNLRINKNRMFFSNVKFKRSGIDEELKQIADGITISEAQYPINGVYRRQDFAGEYLRPDRVHDQTGYCPGETYRFGIRFGFTKGGYSPTFHAGDYEFALNDSSPLTQPRNGFQDPLVRYPVFNNIVIPEDLTDEIISYQIMRVEMDESLREIMATGIALPYSYAGAFNQSDVDGYTMLYPYFDLLPGSYSDFNVFLLVSPDVTFGGTSLSLQSGDKIIHRKFWRHWNQQDNNDNPVLNEYSGDGNGTYNEFDIEDMSYVSYEGQTEILVNGSNETIYNNPEGYKFITPDEANPDTSATPEELEFDILGGYIMSIEGSVNNDWPQLGDFFFYKRPKVDKFGNSENTRYIPCEQPNIISSSGTFSHSCFGGDTFIQKTLRKTLNNPQDINRPGNVTSFYSANRVNSQLRIDPDSTEANIFPQTAPDLFQFVDNDVDEQIIYDDSYSFQNNIQQYPAFDPDAPQIANAGTRIYFSALKPVNSFQEVYGDIPPLNYKDVDLAYGDINHMEIYNGELVHWQDRAVHREYVNAKGLINPEDSTEVLIGSNEVLSRKEKYLSGYGTSHKYSVVKGRSVRGNDVIYWVSTLYNKVVRLGYDGVTPLSDRNGMNSWANNNLDGLMGIDNPTHQGGIHGVWDSRFNEYILTKIRPKLEDIQEWNFANMDAEAETGFQYTLPSGLLFKHNDTIYEVDGEYTISGSVMTDSQLEPYNPENNPQAWKLPSTQNRDAFDGESLAVNEFKDKFTTFYSFTPRIYMEFRNTFFSENPKDHSIHIHNEGDYLVFYGDKYEGNLKGIINKNPDMKKVWHALSCQCQELPFRLEMETQDHESYLTFFEVEDREGHFRAPVKFDSSLTGINDGDSERLRGTYIFVDFYFEPRQYQKLFNFVVKGTLSPRNVNT